MKNKSLLRRGFFYVVNCCIFVEKMEAKELRIGNLILFNGNVLIVSGVIFNASFGEIMNVYAVKQLGELPALLHGQIEPISLTEEWLLKFGFEKDRNGFYLHDINNLSFTITKEGYFLACWKDRQIGILVNYVHQLQNLYFALTGEEF